MVKALHRAGIEVILDVVYNHTAEGNHLGPMLSFKGVDNASYYRLMPDDPRFYMDFTGTGNSLNPVAAERAAADHGLAALLRDRVPRRRLPLRPRLRAGARALRRRPAVGVLRRHPPGPGAVAGQADRRAVGRRPGRLPGRQLPGAVDGVERHLPRRDARLLARPGRHRRLRQPAHRLDRPLPVRRPPPVRVDQLRHRPRRLHARTTSSRTTRSTTRPTSRTTATAPTTTARGTAASRARPTTRRSSRCAARQQRNFLATLLLSQGVPMLLGGDERQRSQGGNNNAWCQDNEISWFDWEQDERANEQHEFTRRLIALRRGHPVFRRTSSSAAETQGLGPAGLVVVPPRRPEDDAWRLAVGRTRRRHVPQRRGDRDADAAAARTSSTTRS